METIFRAVLLDMGGVLLRMTQARGFPSERLDWRGRQAMLRRGRADGAHLELEDLEHLVFGPWRAEYARRQERGEEARWDPHLARLRRERGVRADDLALLSAWFRPYGESLQPVEGVDGALRQLRALGLGLALVSNVPLPGSLYRQVLEHHGLACLLDHLLFSYDCGTRKPSPAILRLALKALEVQPEAAVMVGDRRDRDVAAGRAAGTATVWVRGDDGGGPQADAVIDSLGELSGLLAAWPPRAGG